MSEVWTSDQVRIILSATLNRIKKDRSSFKIKLDGNDITMSSYQDKDNSIYISLNKNNTNVYVSLNSCSGLYGASSFFWKDKEIKASIKELKIIALHDGESPSEILFKCFPEAIGQEFETKILGVRDGKN